MSPAYDINPSIDKEGLALNIDMSDSTLSFQLAKSVGELFQLNNQQMDDIINEVMAAREKWEKIAGQIGISRIEQELMSKAFTQNPRT